MFKDNLKNKSGIELTFFFISVAAFFVSALVIVITCIGAQNHMTECIRSDGILIAVATALIVSITLSYEKSKLRCLISTWLSVLANLLIRNNSGKLGISMTSGPEITWSIIALLLILFVLIIVTIHKEKKAKKAAAVQLKSSQTTM